MSLALATEHELRTIAFPSISTGAYGFPVERAARIAIREMERWLQDHGRPESVTVVAFDEATRHAYEVALGEASKPQPAPPREYAHPRPRIMNQNEMGK